MKKLLRSDIEDCMYAVMYNANHINPNQDDYPIALFLSRENAEKFVMTFDSYDEYYIVEWEEMFE